MPRVSEVDDPGDDPLLKEAFAKETEAFGFVLNTTKIQAHTPGIMRAAKQLSAAVEAGTYCAGTYDVGGLPKAGVLVIYTVAHP